LPTVARSEPPSGIGLTFVDLVFKTATVVGSTSRAFRTFVVADVTRAVTLRDWHGVRGLASESAASQILDRAPATIGMDLPTAGWKRAQSGVGTPCIESSAGTT
jgi:hypothetical protein